MRRARTLLLASVKGFLDARCGLHAAGLTYFSLLSFVPILCLSLLLAKMCGVGDVAREQINIHLDAYITQLETVHDDPTVAATMTEERRQAKKDAAKAIATQARDVSNQLFDRAAKFNASTLGWIGLAMLAWTVISTFGMVETSMNEIWSVKKLRPLWKRCVLYLLVTVVTPILAAIALSMPILNVVKSVLEGAAGYIPYSKWFMDLLVSLLFSKFVAFLLTYGFAALGFGFFYKYMPYCRVETRWALLAGVIQALVFGLWLRVCIIAQVGVANSSVLYGSFAFFPILLAWIYISWQIILFGSVLSCQLQSIFSSSEV
jgi:YihY family inner membrane protein